MDFGFSIPQLTLLVVQLTALAVAVKAVLATIMVKRLVNGNQSKMQEMMDRQAERINVLEAIIVAHRIAEAGEKKDATKIQIDEKDK